jgi:hypothetical protein
MIYAILTWPLLGAAYYPYQRWASKKQGMVECTTVWFSMAIGPLGWMIAVPMVCVSIIALCFTFCDKQINEEI